MIELSRHIKTITVTTAPTNAAASLFGNSSKQNVFIADLVRNETTGNYELISTSGPRFTHIYESRDDEEALKVGYQFLINAASKEILSYIFE